MQREYLLRQNWIVHRPRIHEMLEAGLEYPLISVVAGEGYGKTTAVADFCRDVDRRLIWMRLLPVDNDTERFWRRFRDEIKHELPALEEGLSGMDFPDTLETFDDFLRTITREGYKSDDVILVFDHLENLQCEAVREFIDSIIRVELETLCTVLISNEWPSVNRRIGTKKRYYIGPDELRFTDEETERLFRHYHRRLSGTDLRALQEYTGGWPLALHLIASRSAGREEPRFGDTHHMRVIEELFEQSYFLNYPRDIRLLLIKLALLPCVSAGVVRLLHDGEAEYLHAILTDNTFISYNYSREMYFFQAMYQDFLIKRESLLPPEDTAALYAAAGGWYRAHRFFREAMDCFWKIGDYDSFLSIVATPPRRWVSTDFTNWILERLYEFPDAYCAEHPQVRFYRALLHVNDAGVTAAKEILLGLIDDLEDAEGLDPPGRTLLGNAYALMVDVSVLQNNMEGLEYAQKAIRHLPNGAGIRTDEMMVAGNSEIFYLADSAAGCLERMLDYSVLLSGCVQRLYVNSGRGYFDLFAAEGLYLRGGFAQAREHCFRAIAEAKRARQHDIVANALFLQMRIFLFTGDGARADAQLRELAEYVEENAPHELVGLKDCAKALFSLHMRDDANVPLWLTGCEELPTDIPLAIGRDRALCAAYLCSAGNYDRAYAILMESDGLREERMQWSARLNATVLKAFCLLKMGDPERAVTLLHHAYEMTWQNGLTTCFAELGMAMPELLDAAAALRPGGFDPRWERAVRAEAIALAKRSALMSRQYGPRAQAKRKGAARLTPREAEAFSYWGKGLSREEIAGILGITVHGVKKHIANIYLKLGAVNRLDAIHIATAQGLLVEPVAGGEEGVD